MSDVICYSPFHTDDNSVTTLNLLELGTGNCPKGLTCMPLAVHVGVFDVLVCPTSYICCHRIMSSY